MERPEQRVLVLGESSRATLAVVRSLGRRGIEVHLGTSNTHAPVTRSRYVRRVIPLPNELKETDAWVRGIADAARTYHYDLVMPTTGATTTPLNAHREKLESLIQLAIAPKGNIELSENKAATLELAAKLGVPVPRSTLVRDATELDAAFSTFSVPIVVKPSSSYVWHQGRWKQLDVHVATTVEEARLAARERLLYAPILLQEYVEGNGVGQEFLCKDGEIVYAFQHDRLREYHGSGGSTLRTSAELDAGMLEASKKLIAAAKWNGVLMIEYRRNDKDGTFALMELNGRFWGSLALPVSLGVDFPYGYYVQKVFGNAPAQTQHASGKRARSIFEDMGHSLSSGVGKAAFVGEYAKALAKLLTGLERWDQFAMNDTAPFFAELKQKMRKRRTAPVTVPPEARAQLDEVLQHAKHILFICYGNINRSAFAENYARARAGGKAEFRSAGEYPEEDRPASVNAQLAAKKYEVSLESHRSRIATPDMISWADVIFVMDGLNERFINETFPTARDKTYHLGMLDSGGSIEIRDPQGLSQSTFEKTFGQIAQAVNALIQELS